MPRQGTSSKGGRYFRDTSSQSKQAEASNDRTGLLSLTLAPSSIIRWILPARIRSQRKHDVVFIGSTYIQLREFHSSGQLSDATAKLDVGTQILNAKVISAKAEMVPTLDAILDQEWDEERYIIKGKPCSDNQPPQIVVLTTAKCELIYVYAKNTSDGKNVEFVFAKRALLGDVSLPESHFKHIAVDPEYKALVVASYSTFTVFSLKDVDDLRESIDSWDPRQLRSFQPNLEQRMIQVDGHILKMDFLRATEEEPDKAILLLIVANAGETLLLLYRWDTRDTLDQFQPMSGNIQRLQAEDRFPLLLIPSQKRASFAIVTETCIAFYDNVRSVNARRLAVPLPSESLGKQKQLWVHWAKPSRHGEYINQKEDILLLSEDGVLRMFTRPHNSFITSATNFSPGKVKIDIDSAVCMLPGPRHMGGDILIVGGSMNDGGVFHLPPRRELYMLQIIPNVSPVHDMVILDPSANKQRSTSTRRTFVTAGAPGATNLDELRFGHEAQIGWKVPLANNGPVNQMWTMEHIASKKLFILVSHPEHTTAIALDLQSQQFEEMDPSTYPGLCLDAPTLAAAMLVSEISLQVTPRCISAGLELDQPAELMINDCVCADINNEGAFVIACRNGAEHFIQAGYIDTVALQPSISLLPAVQKSVDRPMCLKLFRFNRFDYLCVGFENGCVEMLSIDPEGRLTVEGQVQISKGEVDPDSITSMAVLDHSGASRVLILAGTRQGKLVLIQASAVTNNLHISIALTIVKVYVIGDTEVTVVDEKQPRTNSQLGALINCGSRLDQVMSFKNDASVDHALFNVWLTEKNNLSYLPPMLTAVQRIGQLRSIDGGIPSNFVMCATRDDILFSQLIEQEQMIPRRLGLNEKEIRLMTAPSFLKDKLVIASNPLPVSSPLNRGIDASHKFPTMHVIDPDKILEGNEEDVIVVLGEKEQSDRLRVLLSWPPTDGKSHYGLIMAGLSDGNNSILGFVSAGKLNSRAPTGATFRVLMKFPGKDLHSLCTVERASLAVGAGNEIIIITLDVTTRKWFEGVRYALPSPALSLSAQGSFIYVATEKHSMIVLNWDKTTKKLEKVFTDGMARNARVILPFGKNGNHVLVTTISEQGASILAYAIERKSTGQISPLFEVAMPLGIDHIATIPSSPVIEQSRQAFQGISFDGTVFLFQTLSHSEWKLLRFIEQLTQPDSARSAKRPTALLSERMSRNFLRAARAEGTPYLNPHKMHVHGDVLKRIVDQGPSRLRALVGPKIKSEDEMEVDGETSLLPKLESLAEPVIGSSNDIPAAVIAWMRQILRCTFF